MFLEEEKEEADKKYLPSIVLLHRRIAKISSSACFYSSLPSWSLQKGSPPI